MNRPSADPIRISPVAGNRQLGRFISAPGAIYRDDPNWVAPLRFELKQRLTEKNPFFEHARWQAWTAQRNGEIVGRISAQIDAAPVLPRPEAGRHSRLEQWKVALQRPQVLDDLVRRRILRTVASSPPRGAAAGDPPRRARR